VAYSGIGVFGIDHRVEHIEVSIYVFIFSLWFVFLILFAVYLRSRSKKSNADNI